MDVGTTLRTARERRDLTLAELAAHTKIPVHILQALEQNAFERVPRGIFIRGFLRAFATEVGLDPVEIVSQFRAESGDVVESASEETLAALVQARDQEIESARSEPDLTASGPGWGYVLIVAALVVAVVSVNRRSLPDTPAIVSDETRAEDVPRVADERATASSAVEPVVAAEPELAGADLSTLRFDIQAQGPCWVEAVVDGRRLVYRLMQPGERQTIESEREIVLRVGDPGALTYSINGAAGEPLGRAGMPVTVRFTNQGEKAALAS